MWEWEPNRVKINLATYQFKLLSVSEFKSQQRVSLTWTERINLLRETIELASAALSDGFYRCTKSRPITVNAWLLLSTHELNHPPQTWNKQYFLRGFETESARFDQIGAEITGYFDKHTELWKVSLRKLTNHYFVLALKAQLKETHSELSSR